MQTRLMLITGMVLALLTAIAFVPSALAQATDPASVYSALVTAQNAHNVDAAAALFDDNAVVVLSEQALMGKAEITAWLQAEATQNFQDTPGTPQINGNTLISQDQITSQTFTQEGMSSASENIQVVVDNGKITTYVARLTVPSEQAIVTAIQNVKPPTDPISVVAAVQAADNQGDTATSASYYAADAVISGVPSATSSGIYAGTDAITAYLQQQATQHIRIMNPIRVMVTSTLVLSTAQVTDDTWKKLGVAPLEVFTYFEVVNGKIECQIVNLTPTSLVKLAAANKSSS